ncbi:MAG: ferritin family protein [Bacteroidales bacterium]|nr:ferritin family protein [Bacteroidales bacterium]
MNTFNSVDDILNFAIEREQESYDLYHELATRARNREMKEVFTQFSKEEEGHKKRLISIQKSGQFKVADKIIRNLKIGDYLVDIEPTTNMSYQEALILAMKKEKAAFRLYNDLASKVSDGLLQSIFLTLAQEESKHKLRFELEYDKIILKDN